MMLFAEAMGSASARSSLEVMLDAIRRKDEQQKDLPPALPTRPTSRGRLPSSRKSFPVKIALKSNGQEINLGLSERRAEVKEESFQKGGIFGCVEKVPDIRMPGLESYGERPEVDDPVDHKCTYSSLAINLGGQLKSAEAIDYFLKKKLRVWCWIPAAKWECGKIQSASVNDAHVLMSTGNILRLPFENIWPANPEVQDNENDLALFSYINEPSFLHNLKCRYSQDKIYSKAGPVLVALNPFKDLSLQANNSVGENPHVFAVVDQALNEILRGGKNQSIIISGESCSGKTETAKLAMQRLVAIGSGDVIDFEVLKENVILESFGNAKTLKNGNSSRFGKLNEIYFSEAGKICGARIKTFLLEKSRVVERAVGERSFHIFYQLCAGAPPCLKEKLNLKTANEYEFLKQSRCLTIENIDDSPKFQLLMEALDTVHITKDDQDSLFSMLAAVLWLGNICFSTITSKNQVEVNIDEAVANAANLLGCEVDALVLALSTQTTQSGNDNIVQKLTLSQAIETRDALAKSIYATLFDWVVVQINKYLQAGKTYSGSSISILDTCGFEVSHKNGFDQFSRNYASERMQQHFINHLLKHEQEEYTLDGVDWRNIDFPDNVDCLNLFDKPQGILSLLDEESACSKATDFTLLNKLKDQFLGNPCFKGESSSFRICHYAGEVLYNTSGFLKNNREIVHEDSIKKLLLSCGNRLPRVLGSLGSLSSSMQSAATKLKDQLSELIQLLENTKPHFISCINPNSKQLAGIYEEDFVIRQLRSFSLLEVARITRSGYPTRMTHQQFVERYNFLLMENTPVMDSLSTLVAVLQQYSVPPGMYQVGYTKIFFRSGQLAILETARASTLQGILCAQKYFRGARARRSFNDIKNGVTTLQSCIRAKRARNEFHYLARRHRATVLIQKHVKRWVAQKAFAKQQKLIMLLQSVIRGWLARKHFNISRSLEMTKCNDLNLETDLSKNLHEFEQNPPPVEHSVMVELESRVLKAEADLRQKEEENSRLRQQLQQYEMRWSDYDAKMKSLEDLWQKQMTSLQMSLAAAKRSLATNDVASLAGRPDLSPSYPYFDSEDAMSVETYTTEGTPAKRSRASGVALTKTPEGVRNTISHLFKEFEERRQIFEDDAGFLVEVKSGLSVSNINPDEELSKLKVQFASWKKNYRVRLREAKAVLKKLGNPETTQTRRKWWGNWSLK
ncbi:hypothetical protein KFK09_002875 [Dendrobium nobile]|uniref:Uncharacterized protein n=1 Tax=Dendrobium nobile TaxID=94219 RepID=A0A8T3C8E4_DENNO|nr:hypothetical protein KFK09_002875 [Dendrobium nobile]